MWGDVLWANLWHGGMCWVWLDFGLDFLDDA